MSLRTSLSVALVFAAVCATSAAEPSRFVARLAAGKPQVIVTYGTSLTAGGAWVEQLRQALAQRCPGRAQIVNSGGSGMFSKWGVDNLDARVIQKQPDAVFIEFAMNDAEVCPGRSSPRRNGV
jgi:alpha-L-rhamnosidase/acyl-CoA thioesterase-1